LKLVEDIDSGSSGGGWATKVWYRVARVRSGSGVTKADLSSLFYSRNRVQTFSHLPLLFKQAGIVCYRLSERRTS
jgi:hypothetical protein